MTSTSARPDRIFAPEVIALRAKFIDAFDATTHMHDLSLTPRESVIFKAHPEVFEDLIGQLGGAMRRRDLRPFPRSLWSTPAHCTGEHELHAVWTWSLWRPWRRVQGMACTSCDLFLVDPAFS